MIASVSMIAPTPIGHSIFPRFKNAAIVSLKTLDADVQSVPPVSGVTASKAYFFGQSLGQSVAHAVVLDSMTKILKRIKYSFMVLQT